MERLESPQGNVRLSRHPVRPNETLRPWDAADEYVLAHLAESGVIGSIESPDAAAVVLVNDTFGVLATVLSPTHPVTLVSDSVLDHLGATANIADNGFDGTRITALSSLDPLPDRIDLVVLRIPKSLALLEDQLLRLRPRLHAGTTIVGAAMSKHIHTSTLQLIERIIGPTTTSLAVKKARLVHVTLDPSLEVEANPWPVSATLTVPAGTARVTSHAGVFASDRLDIGTAFLLEHVPSLRPDQTGDEIIVDLGCGNGTIGVVAALANPDAEIVFCDVSYMAIESAKATWADTFGLREATFRAGDGMLGASPDGSAPIAKGSVHRVLNNPPFHVDHAITDATAWQMFQESRHVLRAGGELWVVGNRHLAYHAKLKRLFGNCDVVASSSKFVLLRAIKR